MSDQDPVLSSTTFVKQETINTFAIPGLAHEELLDALDPLRHLMDPSTQDDSRATGNLNPDSSGSKSHSELLSVLPHQQFSESDGVLDLIFSAPTTSPLLVGETGRKETRISIKLVVDAAPGCGGIAWPAGQILSSYLTQTYRTTTSLCNKTILELGSGTGLVGLIAGKLEPSCNVYLTDQAPLLEIMNKNVALNSLTSNVKVAELNWGEPIPPGVSAKPDIILAADCVYFEPSFPLLVQTLSDLSDATTHILFCYKRRRRADRRFFSLLRKSFTWTEVDDDSNRRIYNRESITLLRLHKIPDQQRGRKQQA